jgi:hypothetical protein
LAGDQDERTSGDLAGSPQEPWMLHARQCKEEIGDTGSMLAGLQEGGSIGGGSEICNRRPDLKGQPH